MSYNRYSRDFEINESKIADFLNNAVEKINTEEDIDTLTELISLFRKNVPLSRRKYVTALLLKEVLKHSHSYLRGNRNADRHASSKTRNESRDYKNEYKNQRAEKAESAEASATETEERPRHPRVEIPEDQATSIFVSIGKNRRVYPRDLVGLLVAVGGLDRDRIGDIKVLANYSFVQLYTEDCQTAIDKLNGYDYRGRKLVVSFSKQKEDDSAENEDALEDEEIPVRFFVEQCVDELSVSKCMREQRIMVDMRHNPDLYLQINCISAAIPQIVRRETQYMQNMYNGFVVTDFSMMPAALDYFLGSLANWNQAKVYSCDISQKFTTKHLLEKWKDVRASLEGTEN